MTLLEILIVLAIVGGLLGVLLGTGLFKSNEARMREAAVEVMATFQAAYNMTTVTGNHHRVVFNLDEQSYHIEVCAGAQTLVKAEEKEDTVEPDAIEELKEKHEYTSEMDKEIIQASSPEDALAAAAALEGLRIGTARCQPATTGYSGQPTTNGNRHKLDTERKIHIEEIYVQHITDPVDEGTVSINFFPVGSAEKAMVIVADGDGNSRTVLLHGMTSRVEIKDKEIDPDDHMRRDGAGDEVAER